MGDPPNTQYFYYQANWTCTQQGPFLEFRLDANSFLTELPGSFSSDPANQDAQLIALTDEIEDPWLDFNGWTIGLEIDVDYSGLGVPSKNGVNEIAVVVDLAPTVQGDAAEAFLDGVGTDLEECDIVIYTKKADGSDIPWSRVPDPFLPDLERVLAHEIGHCYGLGDQDFENYNNFEDSLMRHVVKQGLGADTLSFEDQDAMRYLYPAGATYPRQ